MAKELSWAQKNPQRARELQQRDQARHLGARVEPVDVFTIWERDNKECQIHLDGYGHDKMIRIYEDEGTRWQFVLDHMYPLADGGPHEPENVQAAHDFCNQRRGDAPW